MPRHFPAQPPAAPPTTTTQHNTLLPPITVAFSFLIALTLCFRKFTHKHKRTSPSPTSTSPRRFSYASLRRATASFSPSRRLGQGGFGSVYNGTLTNGVIVAVKVMDSGSLQGEREFQNELFLASKFSSSFILSLIGFSSDRKRRRMVLVYELMENGSLQDCLFHRKCVELREWKTRFSIAVHVAKGLEYLHHFCDPPVIHGDIKPSNILLDCGFNAKIGDFGLATVKSEGIEVRKEFINEDNESGMEEEVESVVGNNVFDEFSLVTEQSPESFVRVKVGEVYPEGVMDVSVGASPSECLDNREFDGDSVMSGTGNELVTLKSKKNGVGKDWWWKQDNGGVESSRVKDYVTEWIGNEIKKEQPKIGLVGGDSSSRVIRKPERKKSRRTLDWWVSLDEEKSLKKEKRRPAREWWREEYCEELAKKKKKKKKEGNLQEDLTEEEWWQREDDDMYSDKKKKRRRSRGSRGSIDWWLDGLSGELWRARRNSHDSVSGEIPKSGGISSTPSMRGTVCYVAPECSTCVDLSEKSDVYSYGVVLLVIISGRRPLQVTGSPLSEFQRANLLSWARRLARSGKLLDLVDQSIQSFNTEEALRCLTVALLCLQKLPANRPSMKEVVGMLSGDLDTPPLPVELSPSPPSGFTPRSLAAARKTLDSSLQVLQRSEYSWLVLAEDFRSESTEPIYLELHATAMLLVSRKNVVCCNLKIMKYYSYDV
ncbi:receptor-like serine/threonine-protein kinase [Heracleum sosnowskyi]|uniref:Receptor-like serine/threonine-protein kinase n=1 Tax=Heracleum sosnowskyi TaxID=360622 RepID=A0AAD8IX08_9APIA|nr:receptor-like serine/threonine-protein kinase [Heracleum sosnowskyi]